MRYGIPLPVCLCKGGKTTDVTRLVDLCRVHLCLSCGGVRIEARS